MEKPPEFFDDRYNPEEEMERNRLFHLEIDDTRGELDGTALDAESALRNKLLHVSLKTSELSGEMVSNFTKIESLLNQRARFVNNLEKTTDESEKITLAQRIANIDNIIPKIRAENNELEARLNTITPEQKAKEKIFEMMDDKNNNDYLKN